MEKLDYLIEYLLNERNEKLKLDKLSYEDKKIIFRSLCNIRNPQKIGKEFLKVQDKFLQKELKIKGIVKNIEGSKILDKIYLWKGDITVLKVDGIVNAANSQGLRVLYPLS